MGRLVPPSGPLWRKLQSEDEVTVAGRAYATLGFVGDKDDQD
jgi:hypothetical protein